MVRYVFYGVVTNKKAADLLHELRQTNANVVGCVVFYSDKSVVIDFSEEPTTTDLESIKSLLASSKYEKIADESYSENV